MPVNLNGMDPRVLAALKKIQADALARGIQTNLLSGYRTYQDQVELAANAAADRAGTPLPYSSRGHVAMAAAPGSSPHERGFAFDLQATDAARQAELESLAPSVGLRTISGDPHHFELATAGAGAGPGRAPAGPSPFLQALQHFESGGRNINNVTQGTSSGQAQGYNQITTGTWRDFGGLKYAPTPQQATKEQQDAIAFSIPLKRWDPKTLAYLQQKGFKLNPDATLGENIANNGGTLPTSPTGVGAPQTGDDWQALLGAEAPPDASDLGSTMAEAVSGPSGQAPEAPMSPPEPLPRFDQSYALASPPGEELGARYQQGKETRKLTPLGQLFTLPTIGQPKTKLPAQPAPFSSMGIG